MALQAQKAWSDLLQKKYQKNTYINIMNQYHPCFRAFETPPLNRRITDREYRDAIRMASGWGLRE